MVMSFCKKSVHAFLGLTTSIDTTTTAFTDKLPCHHHISSSLAGGLGLISAAGGGDIQRSPNVLESSSVKSTPPPPPPPPPPPAAPMMMTMMMMMKDKDPRGIGFIDDIGGSVDGLMSCTESLGFESSDERRFDDKIEEEINGNNESSNDGFQRRTTISTRMKWRKEGAEVKKFPPPLSSMTRNGQRNFFFRAVRKDGRLELTEVRIDRTEILRASRQDGRLRLHLIRDDPDEDEEEETDFEEEEEEEEEEEVSGDEEDRVEEEKEEEESGEWKFPASGDGVIRCHELASHHHHQHHSHHQHNLHIWRQHCVTTG
ncbi:uncharacterized protein LOC132172340 [Corylus avellana]|uniref:uncharacterized protein LOC132172340 n=1 Tax=Corylus avellana TaxID=13451 RepID=UPI001E239CF4|nr:uncharacterized protein LOC132172340 [Corylus avellana]